MGILLAAGQSERFGSNKLLYPVAENKTMLQVSLDNMTAALSETIVVINQSLVSHRHIIERPGVHVIVNEQAEQGLSSSIAAAIRQSIDAPGWMIGLADMPYIETETLRMLVNHYTNTHFLNKQCIVAPACNGVRGHPVIFGSAYKQELLGLRGDMGARKIIQSYQGHLVMLDTDDQGVLLDIDHHNDIK